ncbi:hypothetical protein R1flu_008495 [Riccia fluitans]|uniref:Uncharacterized protein n=1 Tax=Riccia fluitans TaxID=41844 RepID=A0ABD1YC21_9MARC
MLHETISHNDALSYQSRVYGISQQGRSHQEAADRQQTSESVGGKADSGCSSFVSTPSKKPKIDLKIRSSPVSYPQVTADKLPTAALKRSLSLSKEEMHINIEQEMHTMRQTILDQEALFREQVRELHRVHKVQTLLMEEMKKKDADLRSSSGDGGCTQSLPDFTFISLGGKRNVRGSFIGQFLENPGFSLQASIALEEPIKTGLEFTRSEPDVITSSPEIMLYSCSDFSGRLSPARKSFDLERSPEDDDDEHKSKLEDGPRHVQEIKFIGLPTSCTEPESDGPLNLGTRWDWIKVGTVGQEFLLSPLVDEQDKENSRVPKRPRGVEETPLLPLFATKADIPDHESRLRPAQKAANQNLLGGLFHLQVGGKEKVPFSVDINAAVEEDDSMKKSERLSLNLEVEQKVMQVVSQAQPHWLFRDKPDKEPPCDPEASAGNMTSQELLPQPGSCDEYMLKLNTSSLSEERGRSVLNEGSVWDGEMLPPENLPKPRPQYADMQRRTDEVQPIVGVYSAPFLEASGTTAAGPGFSLYYTGQLHSCKDGEGPKNGFSHGVFVPSYPIAGGVPALGMQRRSSERHHGFASQGVVFGSAVNNGTVTGALVGDSRSGVWLQQRSPYSQFQQFQQQQELASLQAQTTTQLSSQTPRHISQGVQQFPQGAVYAIPSGASSSIGLSTDSSRRIRKELPGVHWPVCKGGPTVTAASVVTPPKPSFKRPPKLGGAVGYPRGGMREGDDRAISYSLMDKSSPLGGVNWTDNVAPRSHGSVLVRRNSIFSEGDRNVANEKIAAATDEVDNNHARSGGLGVGDVINPGDSTSPLATPVAFGNVPKEEGEKTLHLGEQGTHAGHESQHSEMCRPLKSALGQIMDSISVDERSFRYQNLPHDQLAMFLAGNNSSSRSKVDGSDCSNVSLNRMELQSSVEDAKEKPLCHSPQHHGQEPSATSPGCCNNLPETGSRAHASSPEFRGEDELRSVQVELQWSSGSVSELQCKLKKLHDAGKERAESKEGSERRIVGRESRSLQAIVRDKQMVAIAGREGWCASQPSASSVASGFKSYRRRRRPASWGQLYFSVTSFRNCSGKLGEPPENRPQLKQLNMRKAIPHLDQAFHRKALPDRGVGKTKSLLPQEVRQMCVLQFPMPMLLILSAQCAVLVNRRVPPIVGLQEVDKLPEDLCEKSIFFAATLLLLAPGIPSLVQVKGKRCLISS